MVDVKNKSYLPKFEEWIDQFKRMNPLEYESLIDTVFYNNSHEVLWIYFKEPEFSICITESDGFSDHFGFYIAEVGSKVKLRNCNIYKTLCSPVSQEDKLRLEFLNSINLIKFRFHNYFNTEITFTLTKRIVQHGSI